MNRSEGERERLRGVYQGYGQDPVRRRWASSNPGNRAILAERVERADRLLAEWGGVRDQAVLLDVGCGTATTVASVTRREGLRRLGVDLLFERVIESRDTGLLHGTVCGDAAALPFRTGSVDLATMFTVISSVGSPELAEAIGHEVARVLRPGGAVLWYDLRRRNPFNPNIRPLGRQDAEALFPGFHSHWRSVTLLPPIARRLGPLTGAAYPMLAAFAPARSHWLGLLVKPG